MKRVGTAVALWTALMAGVVVAGAETPPADPRAEYGVNLAIAGEAARAESVFVTMLSHTHGDARALNNLGNLRLLRGETGVALAFYDRALRGDSLDAGIHLNRATALLLIGDDARAEASYATGVRLAGGLDQAQALLGLPHEAPPASDRAAQKTLLDAEQIRAALKHAAAAVPSDTTHAGAGATTPGAAGKKPSAWRSAGPRASDGSDNSRLLYWKH
jgi:tetratricopeptide (TPR) repeat protein